MTGEVRWFVGIDWATERHQLCLLDADGRLVGERSVLHGGGGLAEACDWLTDRTGAAPAAIAVAIEVPHGPVVEALLERGFQVYAVNPKQLDRFRDRFSVAGAKDDRRDAQVLASALRTDRPAFRSLSLDDPLVIELREWSRMSEDLQQERNRLTNRLREQLWRYYPQMLALGGDPAAAWQIALWRLAPTPADAARLRQRTVERLLRAHRIRRLDAAAVLKTLRQKPLAVGAGTVAAATAHIRLVIDRLELVDRQLKAAHRQLEALCDRLAEAGGTVLNRMAPVGGDLTLHDPVMPAVLNEEQDLCGEIGMEYGQPGPARLSPTHIHTTSGQLSERSLVELLLQFRQ